MGLRGALSVRRGAVVRGVSGLAIVLTVLACRWERPVAMPTPSVPGEPGPSWTVLVDSGARHRVNGDLCGRLELAPLTRLYPDVSFNQGPAQRHGEYVDERCGVTVGTSRTSPNAVIVGVSASVSDVAADAADQYSVGPDEGCAVIVGLGTAARACDHAVFGTSIDVYDGDVTLRVSWGPSFTYQGDLPDLTAEMTTIARSALASIRTS